MQCKCGISTSFPKPPLPEQQRSCWTTAYSNIYSSLCKSLTFSHVKLPPCPTCGLREVFSVFTLSWVVLEGHFCHLQLCMSNCLIAGEFYIRWGVMYMIVICLKCCLATVFYIYCFDWGGWKSWWEKSWFYSFLHKPEVRDLNLLVYPNVLPQGRFHRRTDTITAASFVMVVLWARKRSAWKRRMQICQYMLTVSWTCKDQSCEILTSVLLNDSFSGEKVPWVSLKQSQLSCW